MLEGAEHLKSQSQQVITNVYEYMVCERDNGGPLLSLGDVYKRVSAACGIGLRSVQSLNARCKRGQKLTTPGKRRPNSQRRVTAVDGLVMCKIRQIIFDLNTAGSHFTLNRILSTIRSNGVEFEGSRTSLGTMLKHLSMKWLKANNCRLVLEHRDVVTARRQFLRRLRENRQSKSPRPVIYVGQTCLASSGTKKNGLKNSDEDQNRSSSSKSSSTKQHVALNAAEEKGFLENASQIFTSTKCIGRLNSGEMNFDKLERWLVNKLVPSLPDCSLVVLEPEFFNDVESDKWPNTLSSKSEVISWLNKHGVCCTADMIKAELLQLVGLHRPIRRSKVDELLEQYGHVVVKVPTNHCDLNPLHEIFSKAKSSLGVAATHGWVEALSKLSPADFGAAWSTVLRLEEDYWTKDDVIDGLVERLVFHNGDLSSDDSDTDMTTAKDD